MSTHLLYQMAVQTSPIFKRGVATITLRSNLPYPVYSVLGATMGDLTLREQANTKTRSRDQLLSLPVGMGAF